MLTDAVCSCAHSSLVLVGLLLAKSMVVVCSLSTSTAGTCLCFYKNLFCFRFLLFTVVPSKWLTGNVVLNVRYACISEITLTAILKEVSEVPLVLAFQCFIFLIHYKLNKSSAGRRTLVFLVVQKSGTSHSSNHIWLSPSSCDEMYVFKTKFIWWRTVIW